MASAVLIEQRPLIRGDKTPGRVTADICGPLERRAGALWWAAFVPSVCLLALGGAAVAYLFANGVGVWGLNRSVGWAFDITNFVFWVGIGHAGTLISAILFLFRQKWRTSVNRSAEAMTIFAVCCAGLFPVIHMGRPWLFYWFVPYPNDRGPLWVNFRSPLLWDFFAIGTYLTISLVFWYVGLVPDLATLRDRLGPGPYRRLVAAFSLGWNGASRAWQRYELVYLLLAGLATPLVVSVHSVVSTDFAVAQMPGWHSTIFPPYFVTGAIFSGLAMVLTLMLVARKTMHLEDYITPRHVGAIAKLIVATSCLVGLAYAIEFFTALYSGDPHESFTFLNRLLGPLRWGFAVMIACNVVIPQFLWFARVRRNLPAVFLISLCVNVGMWFERFVIIVGSLERDFLPSSWSDYVPTSVEVATFLGSFGLFFTCFLLFCRWLPVIAMAEVKGVLGKPHAPAPAGVAAEKLVEIGGRRLRAAPAPVKLERSKVYIAAFAREEELLQGVAAARESLWPLFEAYSPYPVHGLDAAMGHRPSRLGKVCFLFGLAGVVAALAFQFWSTARDWPLNIGGQPWNSLPAFLPVTFETMVLCAGLGLVATWLVRCGLYPGAKTWTAGRGETDDRFVLVLVEPGPDADPEELRHVLRARLAATVEERELEEAT